MDPTAAEKKLIDAASRGRIANYRTGDSEADNPAYGANWGDNRTLRAEIIYALCVGTRPEWKVHAKGVRAIGARIVGDLDFTAVTLHAPLVLTGCLIDGPIFLTEARTRTIDFAESHCGDITADGLVTKGDVILGNGFVAKGEVRLLGANIEGDLDCEGARFENPEGKSLNADGLVTKGYVFLRNGVVAKREVRLLGANIGRNLECDGARFENPKGIALNADGLVTKGDVFLRDGFVAKGEVRLLGANIGGNLECDRARFENPSGAALTAETMHVRGALFLRNLGARPDGLVNFGHARVGQLVDDRESWPAPGKLILDGFVYGSVAGGAPTAAAARIRWLQLQPEGHVRPQPYEQLVRVLRQMGHDKEAREIAIAKQRAIRKSGELGWLVSAWRGFLGVTIGYGYKPWKSLIYMAAFLIVGALVFADAHQRAVMMPVKVQVADAGPYIACAKSYPCLQPILYSLDAFLPIVDLHQETYWLPDSSKEMGWLFQWYLWLHISFGWILSTVFVAGLTGLVKKD